MIKKAIMVVGVGIVGWWFCLGGLAAEKEQKKGNPPGDTTPSPKTTSERDMSFGIYPPRVSLKAKPGQQVAASLLIENPHPFVAPFELEIDGVAVIDGDLVSRPTSSLQPSDLSRNIILPSMTFELPPKSNKTIQIGLRVADTLKGTQYVRIVVSRASQKPLDLTRKEEHTQVVGVSMKPAIAMTISVDVEGTLVYDYQLKNVNIFPPEGNKPTRVSAVVQNTGNAEVVLLPLLTLLDAGKKPLVRLKADRETRLVPGGIATIDFEPIGKRITFPKEVVAVFTSQGMDVKLPATTKTATIVESPAASK